MKIRGIAKFVRVMSLRLENGFPVVHVNSTCHPRAQHKI